VHIFKCHQRYYLKTPDLLYVFINFALFYKVFKPIPVIARGSLLLVVIGITKVNRQ